MKSVRSLAEKYNALSASVKASLWFVVCTFLQKGMSVITVTLFTRILTKAEYGNLSVYNSWYTILSIIVALGMANGMHLQGIVKFSEKRDAFTSAVLGLTTVLVLAWTGLYFVFASFWNGLLELNTLQMIALLINIWTGAVFALWANVERVEYRYKLLLAVTLISSLLKPVVEIIMVLSFEDKVTAKVWGTVIVEFLVYFWLFIAKLKKGDCFFAADIWKYSLAFCIPLIPHYLSQTLLNQADRIQIKNLIGEEEAGVYGLAYSVSLILSILVSALNQSATPWIYGKIKEKKEKDLGRIVYSLMLLVAAVSILIIVLAPEIVYIFAPADYQEGIWCIPPVTIGIFFTFCYSVYGKFAFYYEKKGYLVIATFSSAVLNLLLNHLFIPRFGYVAAGYTTMICYILYALFHYIYMMIICRDCCEGRYPFDSRIIFMIQAGVVAAGLLLTFSYKHAVIRYGVVAAVVIIMLIRRRDIIGMISQLKTKS